MTNYLVLTSDTQADANCWGLIAGQYAITIDNAGTTTTHDTLRSLPESQMVIVILNMARTRAYPYNDCACQTLLFSKIKKMLGKEPRIWVHFGGQAPGDTSVAFVTNRWKTDDYKGFRAEFTNKDSGPMPYSQTNNQYWDRVLKAEHDDALDDGLSLAIKNALRNGSTIDWYQWSGKLENAWGKATSVYDPADIQKAMNALPPLEALKALRAVSIYCEDLDYVLNKAKDKDKADAKRAELKTELSRINKLDMTALPEDGQAVVNALTNATDPQEINKNARMFLVWVRQAARKLSGYQG